MPLSNRRDHGVANLVLVVFFFLLASPGLRAQQATWQLGVFTETKWERIVGDPDPYHPQKRWVPVAVKVIRVLPGSAASRNGVGPGDVIYSVNGQRVTSPDALARAIRTSGGNLKLRMETGGDRITKNIALADNLAGRAAETTRTRATGSSLCGG